MFFKAKPQPVPASDTGPQALEWDKQDSRGQTAWVRVTEWNYKVFPTLQASQGHAMMFQIQGLFTQPPLKGLTFVADVEVLDDDLAPPGMLKDRWKRVPGIVEGYGSLIEHDDPSIPPLFGGTLYCSQAAYDAVFKAFLVGFAAEPRGVGLDMTLSFPDQADGPFWKEQWRKETLQVTAWKLFSGRAASEAT